MKIVINSCFGGFSLSPLAIKELAKRKGKECYFFNHSFTSEDYKLITLEEAKDAFLFFAYSVPNPQDYKLNERGKDGTYKEANEKSNKISLPDEDTERTDKDLISVIEKLGEKANGSSAKLKIIEIPDDVKYEISEYDGFEHVAESHRTWS